MSTQPTSLATRPNATPVRSYARENKQLVDAFVRHLISRGNKPGTIRAYREAVTKLTDWLGSASVAEITRDRIRLLLADWFEKGWSANSLNAVTAALRNFFGFLSLTKFIQVNPMLLISYRKLPVHVPRVLTLKEVERLIRAGKNPLERAVPEMLFSTGVRVSELVGLRLEDVIWSHDGTNSIRVKDGKGGKDRVVLFGRKAAAAIREYQEWRPSRSGFVFEVPARGIGLSRGRWYARFSAGGAQRCVALGSQRDFPTPQAARQKLEQITAKIPGYQPKRAGPYSDRAIGLLISKLGVRANIGRVHPHALRRAMASHMLERGANLRVIQDLLGHAQLNTTQRYTSLSALHLKKMHSKFHPKGNAANGKNKKG